LLGLGEWTLAFEQNDKEKRLVRFYYSAYVIAKDLSDKSFYLDVLNHFVELKKQQQLFKDALDLEEEKAAMKDTLLSAEKQKALQHLEVRFSMQEKDRQLDLASKEKDIAVLTNYILWGSIAIVLIVAGALILFLRRINKRDRQLLKTKGELIVAIEEQKRLTLQQMQNDLEFKKAS
jgi:hypothetical protein